MSVDVDISPLSQTIERSDAGRFLRGTFAPLGMTDLS